MCRVPKIKLLPVMNKLKHASNHSAKCVRLYRYRQHFMCVRPSIRFSILANQKQPEITGSNCGVILGYLPCQEMVFPFDIKPSMN